MHLHKSFKSKECKTQLGLAISRLKVTKNKKGNAVIQLRKEVAKLLESGQEKAAFIRVEHVIREEKYMIAYDLLLIYCELIMARLQVIESQKVCPLDLKEAVSCVIFASSRCTDIPELEKARKQFSTKYGKDFVTSILELRNNSGVSPLLIDKLSARSPDTETKIKVLTSIATENNIKWEPNSFEEKHERPNEGELNTCQPKIVSQSAVPNEEKITASNLAFGTKLQGPTSFESACRLAKESTKPEFNSQGDEKHVDKAPLVNDVKESTKNFESESQPNTTTPEQRHEGQRVSISDNREEVTIASLSNRGMGFKNAVSAARAAAESAEQASMAARAAVELASRENGSKRQDNAGDERPMDKLKNKSASEGQVKVPTSDTKFMHIMKGSNHSWKDKITQDRPETSQTTHGSHESEKDEKTHGSHGSGKDESNKISSSSKGVENHCKISNGSNFADSEYNYQDNDEIRKSAHDDEMTIDTRYASLSYDNETVQIVEGIGSHSRHDSFTNDSGPTFDQANSYNSRHGSFTNDSGPTFDRASSYNSDSIDFDDLGNYQQSTSFENQGSTFSSYFEPWAKPRESELLSNNRSSLQARSSKSVRVDENVDENAGNTGKESLPSPRFDTLPPLSYDSEPDGYKEVYFGNLSSEQTDEIFTSSESSKLTVPESGQVLKMENLTGGLRNKGFSRPTYILGTHEEEHLASKKTPGSFYEAASASINKAGYRISSVEIGGNTYDEKQKKKSYAEKSSLLSSHFDSSDEEHFDQQKNTYDEKQKKKSYAEKSSLLASSHFDSSDEEHLPRNNTYGEKQKKKPYAKNSDSSDEEQLQQNNGYIVSDKKSSYSKMQQEASDEPIPTNYSMNSGHNRVRSVLGLQPDPRQSQRTRKPMNSNANSLSRSPEWREVSHTPTKSWEDSMYNLDEPNVLPPKSSKPEFKPPISLKKNRLEDDFESSLQDNNVDLKLPPRRYAKKIIPPASSPDNSAKTSSPKTSKSTISSSGEGSKNITSPKLSQDVLPRKLSVEEDNNAKHVHSKLPDSDKLFNHFEALRSNVRKYKI